VSVIKKVAIIGSSGGNLFHSGGSDPEQLLNEISIQCRAAGISLSAVLFITADVSMDHLKPSTPAKLFEWNSSSDVFARTFDGTLEEVNLEASCKDEDIAAMIASEQIDGLILMSADPLGVNQLSITAAIERQLPIVGTGGTSMGRVKAMGANVIALSGTTGTTNLTRAVSFVLALSRFWKIPYQITRGDSGAGSATSAESGWKQLRISGIMTSSMPAFIAVLLVMSLSNLPIFSRLDEASMILSALPPIILAILAARKMSDLGELTLIAGLIAGLLSVQGGIIGAILAGIAAGKLVPWFFKMCTQWSFPATSVNIAAGGFSGLVPGLLMLYVVGPWTTAAGDEIREALEWVLHLNPTLMGLGFGLCMWPLIMKGWYHSTVLPLILIEMEKYGNSFFGALDMAGLVMVSAGILFAQWVIPQSPEQRNIVLKPFWLNIGFGTFIEASYPYMRISKAVYRGAIVASGLAGSLIGTWSLKSTAYVPSYMALLFSNNAWGFLAAISTGFIVAFAIAAVVNLANTRKSARK
jgi:fructose-specific phosphotransferase system IIC component